MIENAVVNIRNRSHNCHNCSSCSICRRQDHLHFLHNECMYCMEDEVDCKYLVDTFTFPDYTLTADWALMIQTPLWYSVTAALPSLPDIQPEDVWRRGPFGHVHTTVHCIRFDLHQSKRPANQSSHIGPTTDINFFFFFTNQYKYQHVHLYTL